MDGAPQGDFPHRPGGVVGQVGGQDADPKLTLCRRNQPRPTLKLNKDFWKMHSLMSGGDVFSSTDAV